MTAAIVVGLLLLAAGLAYLMKPRPTGPRPPKPGEGMRRSPEPRDYDQELVPVRWNVPAVEAHVLLGLLNSAEIAAGMVPSRSLVTTKGMPRLYDVHVDATRVDEARALLGEDVVDDAGDVGAE